MPPAENNSPSGAAGRHDQAAPVRVSVVMSVWTPRADYFRQAVESVLAQTFADFELIVLEDRPNHEPPTAAAVLTEFADPRIRYRSNDTRVPLATSRRSTLELARGEFVAILDADDTCDPDRLAQQVTFLDAHPTVDVVGSCVEAMDAEGNHLGFRNYPLDHQTILKTMRRSNPLAHPSVMMRKRTALAAGSYRDRGVDAACDDYELWSRMAASGSRFANLPSALVRYRIHDGAMKARLLRATLRDTIRIKQTYWRDRFDFGDRVRVLGERALQWLPSSLVTGLFLRSTLRQELPGRSAR